MKLKKKFKRLTAKQRHERATVLLSSKIVARRIRRKIFLYYSKINDLILTERLRKDVRKYTLENIR